METNLEKNKELAKELEKLKQDEESDSPYWNKKNIKHEDSVYYIDSMGSIATDYYDRTHSEDNECLERSRYFWNKNYAQFRADEIQLLFDMDRFSKENGGRKIDWGNDIQRKYYIIYKKDANEFWINNSCVSRSCGRVYFISKEVAEQAIDKFGDRIKELYTRGD